jgi:hypothetical protein
VPDLPTVGKQKIRLTDGHLEQCSVPSGHIILGFRDESTTIVDEDYVPSSHGRPIHNMPVVCHTIQQLIDVDIHQLGTPALGKRAICACGGMHSKESRDARTRHVDGYRKMRVRRCVLFRDPATPAVEKHHIDSAL